MKEYYETNGTELLQIGQISGAESQRNHFIVFLCLNMKSRVSEILDWKCYRIKILSEWAGSWMAEKSWKDN